MIYEAEYRTVSGKFFQRTFQNLAEFETAQVEVTGTKRQGVARWEEEVDGVGTLTFMVPLDKVEAVLFRAVDELAKDSDEAGE